ncbi:uncharacterized protein LOC123644335 [Lemur catta]|uniref:uncharacterized protein LOC123644335 n=1 Tax=Lemur catta TaxID=9447 RepID=UPI001E26C700|nr:uncharacterized protein LOC123644335 [Lemur catta]
MDSVHIHDASCFITNGSKEDHVDDALASPSILWLSRVKPHLTNCSAFRAATSALVLPSTEGNLVNQERTSLKKSVPDVSASVPEKTPAPRSALSELRCPFVVRRSLWTPLTTMAVTACQGLGFVVSLIGIAGIIAATCMDQWSTQDLYNNPVTAVFNYQGLWRSCVRESSGFTECRGYFTLLGLPGRQPPPPALEQEYRNLRERNVLELSELLFP